MISFTNFLASTVYDHLPRSGSLSIPRLKNSKPLRLFDRQREEMEKLPTEFLNSRFCHRKSDYCYHHSSMNAQDDGVVGNNLSGNGYIPQKQFIAENVSLTHQMQNLSINKLRIYSPPFFNDCHSTIWQFFYSTFYLTFHCFFLQIICTLSAQIW